MIKKIFIFAIFFVLSVLPAAVRSSDTKISVIRIAHNDADGQSDIAEAYYIIDSKMNLCFFITERFQNISTTRVPCRPFIGMISGISDRFDKCE